MVGPNYDLEAAIETWLRAHASYQNYVQASENLYVVFAQSWHGSRRGLAEAFDTFRKSLAHDRGYFSPELNSANPNDPSRIE